MHKHDSFRAVAIATGVAVALAVSAGAASAQNHQVAFLASSSQNGYNQAIYEGIQKKAAELGNVDVEIFDGEFNAAKQFAQVEDLVASQKFDALIIVPKDRKSVV